MGAGPKSETLDSRLIEEEKFFRYGDEKITCGAIIPPSEREASYISSFIRLPSHNGRSPRLRSARSFIPLAQATLASFVAKDVLMN
jgi:hypothetical protein